MNERKANDWFNEHRPKAAAYCYLNFPVDTTVKMITDSVDTRAYEQAYNGMATYADSLFMQLKKQRESYKPTPQQPCPPAVNLDSLRKAVDAETRKRLMPCKDSIQKVVYTVVDHAREAMLQGLVDEKDKTITRQQTKIEDLTDKVHKQRKWPWLFFGLIILIALYIFLKIRLKFPI
jgi:hypothetical protein